MPKRTPIPNKIRFEVFKRDSFKCQYCGKSAPDIILNVDHIVPVSKGGGTDILNLITSCFECNNGKSNIKLCDKSEVTLQKEQLDQLNERRSQLEMLIQWKKILNDNSYESSSILKFFNEKNRCNIELTPYGQKELETLIKQYRCDKIIDAIEVAYDRHYGEVNSSEMWSKLPGVLKFICSTDEDKNKMKFFGGVKGRFNGTSGYSKWNTVNTNRTIRDLFQVIDAGTTSLDYSYLFTVLNKHSSYRLFSEELENLLDIVNGLHIEKNTEENA